MSDVTKEEMIAYLKQHLPAALMTCEDPQGISLWGKYGSMDLKTAGEWDFNKIPDDEARKQVWEYIYPLLMWEKDVPGATYYQDELGSIRYVLNYKGWKWSGTDYAHGISFEKFLQGNNLIILEIGTIAAVSKDLPITDEFPFATGGPVLLGIEEALKSLEWILKKSTYSQGVVYALFEKEGQCIHLQMGSMEGVKGEGPGEEPVPSSEEIPKDVWSIENKLRWEKETGDNISSPGGAQRFVDWVNRQPGGAPGEEPGTQPYSGHPETLFVLTTEDVRTMAQQIGIDPNKLTGVHYNLIKKGIESGLASWADVMSTAIREAIRIEPIR